MVIFYSKFWFMFVYVIKEISLKKLCFGGLINFLLDCLMEVLYFVVVFFGIFKLRNFELFIIIVIFGKKCFYDV